MDPQGDRWPRIFDHTTCTWKKHFITQVGENNGARYHISRSYIKLIWCNIIITHSPFIVSSTENACIVFPFVTCSERTPTLVTWRAIIIPRHLSLKIIVYKKEEQEEEDLVVFFYPTTCCTTSWCFNVLHRTPFNAYGTTFKASYIMM